MAATDSAGDSAGLVPKRAAETRRDMINVIRDLNPDIEILDDDALDADVNPADFEFHSYLVEGISDASSAYVLFIDKIEGYYVKLAQKIRTPLAKAEAACQEVMVAEKEKDAIIAGLQKEIDAIMVLEKEKDATIASLLKEKDLDDVIERPKKRARSV